MTELTAEMKATYIYKLICNQNSNYLDNKVISIWFFKEKGNNLDMDNELEAILNYLVSAGAKINLFIENVAIHTFPKKAEVKYFNDKLDCLCYSETLIIYGKFFNYGTPNELKIAQKIKTGSIIDLGCNFQIKSFMPYEISYINF